MISAFLNSILFPKITNVLSSIYVYNLDFKKWMNQSMNIKFSKPKVFFRFIFVNKIRLPPPFDILENVRQSTIE